MANKDWTEILKDKLEGGGLPEPGVAWDELSAGMDRIVRRRRAWRIAGGAMAAAAAVAAVFLLPGGKTAGELSAPAIAEIVADEPITAMQTEEEQSLLKQLPASALLADASPAPRHTAATATDNQEVEEQQVSQSIPEGTDIQLITEDNMQTAEDTADVPAPEITDSPSPDYDFWNQPEETQQSRKHNRLTIGVGTGLSSAGIQHNEINYSEWGNNLCAPDDPNHIGNLLAPTTPLKPITRDTVQMSSPLTFGISARYSIRNNLFLLGSINASSYKTSFSKKTETEQAWYLGPGFGLGYDLLQSSNASIYTALTGNASWCVSRSDLPTQFSTALLAGAQLHIGGAAWLYLEPQLYYSFSTSNESFIISHENPIQFTVNLGLRFRL